jgi:hypothetical protein
MIDIYSTIFYKEEKMKYVLALLLTLVCCSMAFGQTYYVPVTPDAVYCQPTFVYRTPIYYGVPNYYRYPVTPTYVTPYVVPPRYYPGPVYYGSVYGPVYYGPRVWVSPKVYIEGQPVRNLIRAVTP